MNKQFNTINISILGNLHHRNIIKPYGNRKTTIFKNYLFNTNLSSITLDDSLKANSSANLPLKSSRTKLINPKLIKKTKGAILLTDSKRNNVQLDYFNNNSIYFSNYKNNPNLKKNNAKSDIKYHDNKENICNYYIKLGNTNIKKSLSSKRKINLFQSNFINKKINLEENSKNNYHSNEENINNNSFYKKDIQNIKMNLYSIRKEIKNIKINENNFCYTRCKNKLFNCISPKKTISKDKNIIMKNSSKLCKYDFRNSVRKKIFFKNIEIPKKINPNEFKILNQIGFGSFGNIYIGIWNQNNKKYAIKIMNTQNKDNILYIQEKINIINDFVEETKCDGLIKIYGDSYVKKRDQYYYYVIMELAERDWENEINIRKRNNLFYSEAELLNIMSQLIKTLSLLQKNHITHRDIKLQNILLLNNKYKICDFGEARKLVQKGTIVQPVRGSELYMSPVQFFGLNQKLKQVKHNTYKSDVFSLGMCILYAATLSDDCLYDIRELTDMNVISNILKRYLYNRYSFGFIKLLLYLLEVDEKKRPDFIHFEKIFSQYYPNY